MKLVLINPYAFLNKRAEFANEILGWRKNNVLGIKTVIPTNELVSKHFSHLPDAQCRAVANEWAGAQIEAYLVDFVPEGKQEEFKEYLYISPLDDVKRAERDILLWYPEKVVD